MSTYNIQDSLETKDTENLNLFGDAGGGGSKTTILSYSRQNR